MLLLHGYAEIDWDDQVSIPTRSYSLDRRPGRGQSSDDPEAGNPSDGVHDSDEKPVGGEIASAAIQEQVTLTAIGPPLVVAERGVEALAPSFIPAQTHDSR